MNSQMLFALAGFALVSSITPGPNNLMLMASGANYGFRRTLPHMLGVSLGFSFMILVVGGGLVRVFAAAPVTLVILKTVSVVYLVYLAWKIATAGKPDDGGPMGKPFTFIQAALFQWVNPKAWAMALTAVSVYTTFGRWSEVLTIAVFFCAINLPCVSSWALAGQTARRWLSVGQRLRWFNLSMATLLIASLYPLLAR
ncbi:MAG: LysE family translocator [Gammaproteobacteria bacterium]